MAGSKSISRKPRARPTLRVRTTRRESHVPVLTGEQLHQKSSEALAFVETCWFAIRALDHIPEVGTISMSLGRAVNTLREAHDAVEAFLDAVKS